eukprot:TRINITY_DN4879_c0_g1_i10.p4 TRINITY_DN4879_c0_g1~~TRINITY_DN4879_c0_g1_i10.p4  ORF type:complete len:103 (-),score=5.74 TRINITY_DN4879_c0_g1_i10:227-535(-)
MRHCFFQQLQCAVKMVVYLKSQPKHAAARNEITLRRTLGLMEHLCDSNWLQMARLAMSIQKEEAGSLRRNKGAARYLGVARAVPDGRRWTTRASRGALPPCL